MVECFYFHSVYFFPSFDYSSSLSFDTHYFLRLYFILPLTVPTSPLCPFPPHPPYSLTRPLHLLGVGHRTGSCKRALHSACPLSSGQGSMEDWPQDSCHKVELILVQDMSGDGNGCGSLHCFVALVLPSLAILHVHVIEGGLCPYELSQLRKTVASWKASNGYYKMLTQYMILYVWTMFCYSCSQFLDNVVAIWDIRRPFIPFASFSEHTDDVTGEGTGCLCMYLCVRYI